MKLDPTDLRYLTTEEFRVLTATEMGSKNHEVVPSTLIAQISGLRSGGVNKILGSLAKRNLIAKVQNSKYEGYRLTYGGYDFLAMRALSKRESLYSVGNQIGVGKESDIYAVADEEGSQMVLKLHRLGRISFRAIKTKRDYMGKRKSASWMYMSRLAAQKEWAFMKILYEHNFPVPKPIDQARHCILMEMIDAYPLRQVAEVDSPGRLYSTLMDIIVRFAHAGLIHGDFNEFNILIRRKTGDPVVIDFPQMVSTSHENAEWYFNRDVECIRRFFKRRFQYESALYPRFRATMAEDSKDNFQLDVMVAASGFAQKDMKTLEDYMEAMTKEEGEEQEENQEVEVDEEEEEEEEEEETEESDQGSKGNDDEELTAKDTSDVDGLTTALSQQNLSSNSKELSIARLAQEGDTGGEDDAGTSQYSPSETRKPQNRNPDKLKRRSPPEDVKDKVATEVLKERSRQKYKYNSKRSTHKVGRAKGSKAKQDTRIKLDVNTGWD